MEFRYFDEKKRELSLAEIGNLEIWNATMEHIFAQTIDRMEKEIITGSRQIAKGVSPMIE